VSTALVGFGQDVLAAAAHNFAPQYAASVQNLFLAMAETTTGMPFTEQADSGEQPGVYGEEVYDQQGEGGYGQPAYGQGDYSQESYDQGADGQESDGQGVYGQEAYGQGAYSNEEYDHDSYTQEPYESSTGPAVAAAVQYGTPAGVALEVALLAQQRTPDGQVRLRPVHDGDVLYDGRGDPARGDKIKIFFTANCACYVYVIGIDATGYVAKIFPDGDLHATGPVVPGSKNLVPGGTTWWGLDDYRGVEQIYFIASRERRRDIEDLVGQLAGQRPSLPADYRPVREPAIVAMTRGLVQVQSAAPATVPTEFGSDQQISPTLFQSTVADADLAITRWFRHE
jgi:hypothetical protein